MTSSHLIEPADLEARLADRNLIIVDLCNQALYQQKHVPGAVHLPGNHLVAGTPPVPGACPDLQQLQQVINYLGINGDKQVILYDDEGGGWAGRMAWTMDLLGLNNWCYLNGGIVAWIKEGFVTESQANQPNSITSTVTFAQPEARISRTKLSSSWTPQSLPSGMPEAPENILAIWCAQPAEAIFPAPSIWSGPS